MAISMCSESSSLSSSPRISFSHDLHHTDIVPIEDYPYRSDSSLLNPNSDFDFPVSNNEPSSADELFSQGLIRPLELHQKFVTSKQVSLSLITPLPIPSSNETPNQEISKQIVSKSTFGDSSAPDQIQKHHHQSKSFWKIKRSSSLHCDNTYKKSSFWSLPLLSRSNSTGSVPNSKNSPKDNNQKQIHSKQTKNSSFNTHPQSQKPPPYKKNYGGAYGNGNGNGIRISPVINVPPPFVSKGTANLFGLGSFFGNGKDRKNKK